jgi:hypothetical protein
MYRDKVFAMDDEPNELVRALDRYEEAAHTSAAEIAARTTVAAIPYAGGPILELWNGLAQGRVQDRLNVVFSTMKKQLEEIAQDKVNQAFFGSEEFQTLLYLVLERLHATHQKEKLEAFGDALANSATIDFKKDDKEQYIRTLRELSLEDLQTLRNAAEFDKLPAHLRQAAYPKPESPSLARLASLGLVHESLKLREFDLRFPVVPTSNQSPERYARGMVGAFKQYFEQPPLTNYRLSGFGHRFLKFIAAATSEQAASA